jgi:hypothetical protein
MAMRRYPGQEITIPPTCKCFSDAFTIDNGMILFWFNENNNTDVVSIPLAIDGINN